MNRVEDDRPNPPDKVTLANMSMEERIHYFIDGKSTTSPTDNSLRLDPQEVRAHAEEGHRPGTGNYNADKTNPNP